MNITLVQYNSDGDRNVSIQATIDGQELSIPLDPANRHYAAILEWAKEDGNTIKEAD
tara:strand:+ start:1125 stop:1295 length:171 start_codon:yes stop_codon:yes gene_type:complete